MSAVESRAGCPGESGGRLRKNRVRNEIVNEWIVMSLHRVASGLLARLPPPATRAGLPAREPVGVPFMLSLSFFGTAEAAPSLISAPDPARSASEPDPAPLRARFLVGFFAPGAGDKGREAGWDARA